MCLHPGNLNYGNNIEDSSYSKSTRLLRRDFVAFFGLPGKRIPIFLRQLSSLTPLHDIDNRYIRFQGTRIDEVENIAPVFGGTRMTCECSTLPSNPMGNECDQHSHLHFTIETALRKTPIASVRNAKAHRELRRKYAPHAKSTSSGGLEVNHE